MKISLGIFLCLLLVSVLPAQALADYKYAHNDAEYSVMLPEAPTVVTVSADNGGVPYLENPPKDIALGEIATFRRADAETDESFDVKITFLKADSDFLSKLTEDKMKAALENDFKDINLNNKKFDFSVNADTTLKWATLSGFSIDRYGHPSYAIGHYLTGKQSILVLKVQYSVENKTFADTYKKLADNITYIAP
ncbi:MAG: hypothetical protein K8R48_01155 [Alphaproteobacteria bacterium]|nr:hypothetical protein [Alphaproteobacteria bacterium]